MKIIILSLLILLVACDNNERSPRKAKKLATTNIEIRVDTVYVNVPCPDQGTEPTQAPGPILEITFPNYIGIIIEPKHIPTISSLMDVANADPNNEELNTMLWRHLGKLYPEINQGGNWTLRRKNEFMYITKGIEDESED